MQHLIGGIDVYDIRAEMTMRPSKTGKLPLLQIDDFNASLFDGTVKASPVKYDLNHPDSNFVVDINECNYSPKLSLSRNCITNTLVGNWGHDPIRLCLLNWDRVPSFRINIVPFNSMVNSYIQVTYYSCLSFSSQPKRLRQACFA